MSVYLMLTALTGAAAGAGVITGCTDACQPWARDGAACSIGGKMDLRFAAGWLDDDTEDSGCYDDQGKINRMRAECGTNRFPANKCDGDANEYCAGYKSHFFCPDVDHFASFKLTQSYQYLKESGGNGESFDVFAFGTGPLHTLIPKQQQSGRVQAYETSHPNCPVSAKSEQMGGPAIVSYLIYNVTVVDGRYKYRSNQPVGNGFVNTCPDGSCVFGGDVCVGNTTAGVSNCARCVYEPDGTKDEDIPALQADISVLVTFYGSDSDGRALLSGSSNPMNFRQFASGDSAINSFKNIGK